MLISVPNVARKGYSMNVGKMNREEKVEYMTTTPIPRLVCSMAIPTIISMLITSFYNMADTFFVGKISTQATGAVGVVFSVMALIQACGFFYGHGSGSYISRCLGSGDFEKAEGMAANGVFLSFGTGVLLGTLGLIFLDPISRVLGSTETILPLTKDYLRFILLGTPFTMTSFVLNNQLRFQGSASFSMIGIVTGAVINLILDPIFIFVLDLQVAGAALATTCSQIISFSILLFMTRRSGNIRIRISKFKLKWEYFYEIFRGGIPSLCRQGLASVAQVSLNRAAGFYGELAGPGMGDAAIAAMSIVNRVSMFANSALIGFGQGFQPVCGINYGAKLYERVRKAFFFCIKVGFAFLILISIFGFVFAEPIVATFRKADPQVIEIGTLTMRIHWLIFPLNVFVVMGNMMMQSIGKAFRATLLAAARQGLFFLPLIYILPAFLGLFGVQVCQSVADVCAFVISLPLTISVLREMKRKQTV